MRTSALAVSMLTQSCDNKPGSPWLIQIPLNELAALQALPAQMAALQNENHQLRREIEGLRTIQSQTLQKLGDLARAVNRCQP